MGKSEGIKKLTNEFGKITIAALDHRGSLKASLHPENPEKTRDKEILEWKKRMVELFRDDVSGLLIDPIYGKKIVNKRDQNGWMLSMEQTGYRGNKQARKTELLSNWSVKKAKKMGAIAVKLLLYYDPENKELAREQRAIAGKVAEDCIDEDMVFLLEPLSYKIEGKRDEEVLNIARELKDIKADIFKFEYPGNREACEKITEMIKAPWVLLSAGMPYSKYKKALRIAIESGASGFAVGRAVWQEFGDYPKGRARERYLNSVAKTRMKELVEIVNQKQEKLPIIERSEVKGKKIVVRVDWNVNIGQAMQIVDDTRITRTVPTIKWLLEQGAKKVVLLSHLGKAEEKRSLESVVKYAEGLIGEKIAFCRSIEACRESTARIAMLENLRFWDGEEKNDPEFAHELARLGEIYVNEAFGESHRRAASIVGIAKYLPSYAGIWLQEEVETISRLNHNPRSPYVVIMGGAKVEDKLALIKKLAQEADIILLGGKLANDYAKNRLNIKEKAKIYLPSEGDELLDIGKKTQKIYAKIINRAKTIVWNGPMGKVEDARYRAGTIAVYEAIVKNKKAYSVVGGGDTLSSISKEQHLTRIDHVSTGGGAMLALLESGELPGIAALRDSNRV